MRYLITIGILLFLNDIAFAQGIRKDWTEMTNDERDVLISAYWELGDDLNQNGPLGGLVNEIGLFHNANFSDIHWNSPITTPELDVFLAWHRQASIELQRAMKNQLVNEWITIPYWDWTFSNLKSDDLWGNDWLGPFNSAWDLERLPTHDGVPPSQSLINGISNFNDFIIFSGNLESSILHTWGHFWTGGTMDDMDSPKDPVFFFHHNMVDKIWADWYNMGGECPTGCYIKTEMPRYDGTYTNVLGELQPSVNPNDIVDPRSLGIFYSDRVNSLTTLDKYTVSNANTTSEKFGYQFAIEAKDDFIVPQGNNAEFRSCRVVYLLPGFEASFGSVFCSIIDEDCDFSTNARIASNDDFQSKSLKNAPNPFSGQTNIAFTVQEDLPVSLTVFDISGKPIAKLLDNEFKTEGTHQVMFDAKETVPGIYYYTLIAGDYIETQKMVITK